MWPFALLLLLPRLAFSEDAAEAVAEAVLDGQTVARNMVEDKGVYHVSNVTRDQCQRLCKEVRLRVKLWVM